MKYAMTYNILWMIIEEVPYKRHLLTILMSKCTYLHGVVILRLSVW
jgi:hypothetical protein